MSDLSAQEMLLLKERVFSAAEAGDVAAILDSLKNADEQVRKEVLYHRSNVDGGSLTPLMIAALRGRIYVVRLLLEVYGVAVDQTGTILPYYAEEVTALWCISGHAPVHRDALEALLGLGTNINHMDAEGFERLLIQTCRNGDLEMAKELVSHGADVNLPNGFGVTPLMKSIGTLGCHKTVEFLLQHGANPNRQDSQKRTALHFAVLYKKLDVMNLLLNSGAILMKNSNGLTPPAYGLSQSADVRVVAYRFLQHPHISRQDKVDALETAGALLHLLDLDLGYPYLVEAMEERFSDPGDILSKPLYPPVAALGNIVESQTLEELKARRTQPYALLMECLIIMERALGEADSYWFHYREVCGALQSLGRSDAVLPMWHYLMQRQPKHASKFLDGAHEFIADMLKSGKTPKFNEMKALMDCAVEAWENESDHTERDSYLRWLSYGERSKAALRFCRALIRSVNGTAEENQMAEVVQRLVSVLDGKAPRLPFFLLHSEVDSFKIYLTCDIQSESSACVSLIRLLLDSGARVNGVNEEGNTPLAVVTSFPLSWTPHHFEAVKNVVEMLMKAGAHLDCLNANGQMPLDTGDAHMNAILREFCPLSLKCLASRAIVEHNLPYQSCLPEVVQKFVLLHEQKPSRPRLRSPPD